LNRSDSSKCVTTGCNDKGYGIEEGDGYDDGKGVIEPKPPITSIDDTQRSENTASDLTSKQYTPNTGECPQGKVREEGGGFCAKMPEEFPPETEIDKDPICESSPPPPIIIKEKPEVKAESFPPLLEEQQIPERQPQADLIEGKIDTNIAETAPVVDPRIVILPQENIVNKLEKQDIPADIKTEGYDTAIEKKPELIEEELPQRILRTQKTPKNLEETTEENKQSEAD
jgi:hypothetical protein